MPLSHCMCLLVFPSYVFCLLPAYTQLISGLNWCKSLVTLVGGDTLLAEDCDSGIPGVAGTSFVIDLKKPLLEVKEKQVPSG